MRVKIIGVLITAILFCSCGTSIDEPVPPEKDEVEDSRIYLTLQEALELGLTCTDSEHAWDSIAYHIDTVITAHIGEVIEIPLRTPAHISGISRPNAVNSGIGYNYSPKYIPTEPDVYIFNPYKVSLECVDIDHIDPYNIKLVFTKQYLREMEYSMGIRKDNIRQRDPREAKSFYDIFPPRLNCTFKILRDY